MSKHLIAFDMGDTEGEAARTEEKLFLYSVLSSLPRTVSPNDPDIVIDSWWDTDADRKDGSDLPGADFHTGGRGPAISAQRATAAETVEMIHRLTHVLREYTVRTGGRDLINDWHVFGELEGIVDREEIEPQVEIVNAALAEYVHEPGNNLTVMGEMAEHCWEQFGDEVSDWFEGSNTRARYR